MYEVLIFYLLGSFGKKTCGWQKDIVLSDVLVLDLFTIDSNVKDVPLYVVSYFI